MRTIGQLKQQPVKKVSFNKKEEPWRSSYCSEIKTAFKNSILVGGLVRIEGHELNPDNYEYLGDRIRRENYNGDRVVHFFRHILQRNIIEVISPIGTVVRSSCAQERARVLKKVSK